MDQELTAPTQPVQTKSKEQEAQEILQQAFLDNKNRASQEINEILKKYNLGLKIVETIELIPANG